MNSAWPKSSLRPDTIVPANGRNSSVGPTDVGYQRREADFGRCSDVSSTTAFFGGWQWRWMAPAGPEARGKTIWPKNYLKVVVTE
jgi:hypothetical protein